MNFQAIGIIVGSVLTGLASLLGAWKVFQDSRRARLEGPLLTYRELVRDLTAQRTADKEDTDRRMRTLDGKVVEHERKITELEAQVYLHKEKYRRLHDYAMYLRGLLKRHAPGVKVDPMPSDLRDVPF